jgi:hypothetical protein
MKKGISQKNTSETQRIIKEYFENLHSNKLEHVEEMCKFQDAFDQSKFNQNQAPVAHAYNPNYSGSRDQEDRGSKPILGKYLERPYLKKNHQKNKVLVE